MGKIIFYIVLRTAEDVSYPTPITPVYLNTIRMSLRHTNGINMIYQVISKSQHI